MKPQFSNIEQRRAVFRADIAKLKARNAEITNWHLQLQLRNAAIRRLVAALEHGECAQAVMEAARQADFEAHAYLDEINRETDRRMTWGIEVQKTTPKI